MYSKENLSCNMKKTSWSQASSWYDRIVGEEGHYYHREVIFPELLKLLHLKKDSRLIDLGCGQGVFSRQIPKEVRYVGLEISSALIKRARGYTHSKNHTFLENDLTKPWATDETFTHAVCILALQNIEDPTNVFAELKRVLVPGGKAIFVLNHPCFRIPRQSEWHVEKGKQGRTIYSYMSEQKIPITMHPGKGKGQTWSFHRPLSYYTQLSSKHGLYIETIEEWVSPKTSTGRTARIENRARKELPLFMTMVFRRFDT